MTKKAQLQRLIFTLLFFLLIAVLVGIVAYDMRFSIQSSLQTRSLDPITAQISHYREASLIKACLILSLLQAVLVVFLAPAEWIQVIGAICLGRTAAFFACLVGVCLGSFLLYLALQRIGPLILSLISSKKGLKAPLDIDPKRLVFSIAFLYFVPGIPYGLIAVTAARTKIKLPMFLAVTALCCTPSILLSVLFGSVVSKGNPLWTVAAIVIMLAATVLSIIYKDKLIGFVSRRERRDTFHYFRSNPGRHNLLFYGLLAGVVRWIAHPFLGVKADLKPLGKLEGPCILLFNHPSPVDFCCHLLNFFPRRLHPVMAAYFFYPKKLGYLLHNWLGVFPKFLFEPDFSTLKNIKASLKQGHPVALAPEGRMSPHGTMESINQSTAKLLTNLGVPVYLIKSEGAFLTRPKWASHLRRGKIQVSSRLLFTPEELKDDPEVLYRRLYDALYYDDFAWLEANPQVRFKSRHMAEGLQKILYLCPHCGEEFTLSTQGNGITCSHCGFSAVLTPRYQFESATQGTPKNIRDWFNLQKDRERARIADPDFRLSSHVLLKQPHPEGKGLQPVGDGIATLTPQGLTYEGTRLGESFTRHFPISTMPALPFGAGENFENYADGTYYYFVPDEPLHCVRWSIAEELLYEDYLAKNGIHPPR